MDLIRICTFTERGRELAKRIEERANGFMFSYREDEPLQDFLAESFAMRVPVLFIGACGIAVRMIAPFVKNKLTDSAVLVADEAGQYVIPILSGHVGGANALAKRLADAMSAQAVITTATDVNGLFSADVFAEKNGLLIVNREGIAEVSAKLLREGRITVSVSPEIEFDENEVPKELTLISYPPTEYADLVISREEVPAVLRLAPRPYVVGIGCRKGMSAEVILAQVNASLSDCGLSERKNEICAFASIDLKAAEPGLLRAAADHGVKLYTYSAKELSDMEGSFSFSAFVEQVTGVSNVCERAAMFHAGEGAELVKEKLAKNGVTVAVARRKDRIVTWET